MTGQIQLPASLVRGMVVKLNGKRIEPQGDGNVVVIHGVTAGLQHIVIR